MKKLLFLIILNFGFLTLNCFSQNKNIDSLKTLLQKDKTDTSKVIHTNKLSREYINIGLYDTALYLGNWALQHAQQINFKKGIAGSYSNLGIVYRKQGDYFEALDYYLKALKIDEELGDKTEIAKLFGNIGIVYDEQGDYTKSLDYYLKALKIDEELGNKKGIARHLGNIGIVYKHQGDFSDALDYYFSALKITEELGDKNGIARHFSNIGVIYAEQKDYPKALVYFFKALKLDEELGLNIDISINFINIGSLFTTTRKFKEAELYLKRANIIDDSIGAMNELRQTEEALSELYSTTGRHKEALIHYKKSMTIKDTLFSQENKKQLVRKEMNYEFDKKEAATKAENDKQQAVAIAEKKKQKFILVLVSCVLLLVFLFASFIFRSLRVTRKQKNIIELQKNEVYQQKEIVEKQKHIVEEKQKEILDSITYAMRIQRALLTSDEYIKNNLPAEHFILFKPKDIVSGDFYWAYRNSSSAGEIGKGFFYIATADCTGHGVPGAFMSMLNISYLNENVIERDIRMPNDILNAQRTEIIKALNPPGSAEVSRDGMDCILCGYDFDKMLLHFSAANNPLWLLRKKSLEFRVESSESAENNSKLKTQNFELLEYKADKMPVGKYTEETHPFTLQTIELQKGDIIYTATDGYADQFGTNGKKLMKQKFKEELLKIHHQPMSKQKEYLNQFFETWKGNTEQVDDVCVIGVRI